jgi:hypothetical protein
MAKKPIVVPHAQHVLDQLKYEIAAELGLPVGKSQMGNMANVNAEFASELGTMSGNSGKEEYWGHISTRDAGTVGGTITSRLIRRAEETLFTL